MADVEVFQGTNEAPEQTENEQAPDEKPIDYKAEIKKLETTITRQGWELGRLRKLEPLVDELLLKSEKPKEPVDFFTDPAKAVAQAIESHPSVQRNKTADEANRQQQMLMLLQESHPDYQEVAKDPAFIAWKDSSPKRRQMFHDADMKYDFDSANELLTTFKERKVLANTAKAEQEFKQKSEEDLKAAKVHTGSGVSGKKIYWRNDLMKLKTQDPDAYQALNVQKLYAEGRVK